MQKDEKWDGNSGNPSARLKAARSMPKWMETRGGLPTPPPPPTPDPEPPLNDHDPNYEVIDSPSQNYSNTMPQTTEGRGKRCELCGASGPSVVCEQCPQQSFCPSCDEMYHRHPKRQNHVRNAIMEPANQLPRPPLPPKGETPAPVPPPRRNKKNQLPPMGTNTLKRETGIVGSIKRIITGRSAAPQRAPSLSRDRSASLINNNMDFTRNQMMLGGVESGWTRTGRVGSMTGLNMAPGFGPVMHAQSMAHVGCPSCWGWGSQAALQHAGMHHPDMHHPDMHHPDMLHHPDMHHHGGMMPPPYWYPTWDPRRHRRHHGRTPADTSSDEDEHPSPALSRRSYKVIDSDSDDSFRKSRPQSRRESISDLRRRDDDNLSLRGGRYDDDTRSLRGYRRDSLRRREDTLDREGRRSKRLDDVISDRSGNEWERNGSRRRQDDDDRRLRRRDEDTMSERGGRRLSESRYRDDDSWERSSRRSDKSDRKYPVENVWDKQTDKKKDRHVGESDLEKLPKPLVDKRQDRLQDSIRTKEDKRGVVNLNKSSETISSLKSSASGEDRLSGKELKKDRVFSDTGQSRKRNESDKIEVEPETKKEDIIENKTEKDKEEDDMKPLGPIPTTEWECQHCTYINPPGTRVCDVCCKTRTVDSEVNDENPDLPLLRQETLDVQEPTPQPPQEPEPLKKKEAIVEPIPVPPKTKLVSLSSKGTSPPPQSISTQTYDVAGLGLKKPAPEVGWSSPKRSFSRQSIASESAQSGVSPTRSRSPGEIDNQAVESRQTKKELVSASAINRKSNRGSSTLANDHNTMVQKQVNQGLEMVKLLREAEEVGFSGEEVSVAVEHCGDGSPLQWLLENWTHMIDTVVTLATNYGHERKENTIGTVSEREARAALILHQGSVWSAVTEVVQQRQTKYGELLSRGNFSREDIVTALTAHRGELEAAYTELTKGQLKPFLRRMWPPSNHIGTANHFTH